LHAIDSGGREDDLGQGVDLVVAGGLEDRLVEVDEERAIDFLEGRHELRVGRDRRAPAPRLLLVLGEPVEQLGEHRRRCAAHVAAGRLEAVLATGGLRQEVHLRPDG